MFSQIPPVEEEAELLDLDLSSHDHEGGAGLGTLTTNVSPMKGYS
jgi:hypothetical protein